jgi:hypothetical protein
MPNDSKDSPADFRPSRYEFAVDYIPAGWHLLGKEYYNWRTDAESFFENCLELWELACF